MPEMDGFELSRRIKAHGTLANTRLVMLTGFGQRGDGDAAKGIGINAYLTKPVRHKQLFDCLCAVMSERLSGRTESKKLITRHSLRDQTIESLGVPTAGSERTAGRRTGSLGRILIAEDHIVNQRVSKRQVEKLGYTADVVADGREAVEAAARIPYSLILMDCQMPQMDGLEATAEIRRREGSDRHTPIIAMTASAMKQDREDCLSAGMDDYLSKPTEVLELAAVIGRWLPETKTLISATVVRTNKKKPSHEVPGLEPSVIERLDLFNREFGPEMVIGVIDSFIPDTVQRLIGLRQLVEKSDFTNLAREAHALKGGYGNMGAERMRGLCVRLEQQGRAGAIENVAGIVAEIEKDFLCLRPALERQKDVLSQMKA
jgi:CheY-like chemotaxis protein/HPt (histidine-containing phosphotransfer) domain-containing protein